MLNIRVYSKHKEMNHKNLLELLHKYDYLITPTNGGIRLKEKKKKPILIIVIPIVLTIGIIFYTGLDNIETYQLILLSVTTLIIAGYGVILLLESIFNEVVISKEFVHYKGISFKGKYDTKFPKSMFVSVGRFLQEYQTKDGIIYHGIIYIVLNVYGDQQIPQEIIILSGEKKSEIDKDSEYAQQELAKFIEVPIEKIKVNSDKV